MSYSIPGYLDALEDVIEGIEGAPYALPSNDAPTFRRSKEPLTTASGELAKHLLFSVSVENAPTTINTRACQVEADVRVVFFYKLPAGEKTKAERLAASAAQAIAKAACGPWAPDGVAHTLPRNIFQPGAAIGDFLPVELRFVAVFDVDI